MVRSSNDTVTSFKGRHYWNITATVTKLSW